MVSQRKWGLHLCWGRFKPGWGGLGTGLGRFRVLGSFSSSGVSTLGVPACRVRRARLARYSGIRRRPRPGPCVFLEACWLFGLAMLAVHETVVDESSFLDFCVPRMRNSLSSLLDAWAPQMRNCRQFLTPGFSKCEAVVACVGSWWLLDVLLIHWAALACPHGLSLFRVCAGIVVRSWEI